MEKPVIGKSDNSYPQGTAGVLGTSSIFNGVLGYTTAEGHAGVAGACDEGMGNGLYGRSKNRIGVVAISEKNVALHAETRSDEAPAVAVYNVNANSNSAAIYAKKNGSKGSAAIFEGNVNIVVGDLNVKSGLLKINGQSVWELIYNLQTEVNALKAKTAQLEAKLLNVQQTANSAYNKAYS
ncbi:MAG: hypothetical protein JSS91_02220 [Bacteroidetes bacterium]|nr:hypothetical protein [Bacteroidota bacterium]